MPEEPNEEAMSTQERLAVLQRIDQQNTVALLIADVAAQSGGWLGASLRTAIAEALWAEGYRKVAQTPVTYDDLQNGDMVEMHARGIVIHIHSAGDGSAEVQWEEMWADGRHPVNDVTIPLLRKVID